MPASRDSTRALAARTSRATSSSSTTSSAPSRRGARRSCSPSARTTSSIFAERLRGFVRHLVVLQGGMTAKNGERSAARLAAIPDDEERLVLATGRYIGEGFDDARLDTCSWRCRSRGRGRSSSTPAACTASTRKTEVRIFDYVDREVPMLLRMFEKRLRATAPSATHATRPARLAQNPTTSTIVEYDEEALRHFDEAM